METHFAQLQTASHQVRLSVPYLPAFTPGCGLLTVAPDDVVCHCLAGAGISE
jgi:hypothetical protein